MSTLAKCNLCPSIYEASAFFAPGDMVSTGWQLLAQLDDEAYKRLATVEPNIGYTCPHCIGDLVDQHEKAGVKIRDNPTETMKAVAMRLDAEFLRAYKEKYPDAPV